MYDALQKKKLFKENLGTFQDHITNLPQPDSMLGWISLTLAMTGSDAAGPVSKERKLSPPLPSIAPIRGHKYNLSHTETLYLLGISRSGDKGIIPSVPDHTKVCNHVPEPSDLPLLSRFIKSWFLGFEPNGASLVHYLCRYLFSPKVPTSDEQIVTVIHGPFKSHSLHDLVRGDEAIKYPTVKRDPFREEFNTLQTPFEDDLRARV